MQLHEITTRLLQATDVGQQFRS